MEDANKARLLFGSGRFEEALLHAAPLQRYHYQVALGRIREALDDLKEDSPRAHATAADTLLRRDNPRPALAHLQHAIQLQPDSPSLKMARAECLIELGEEGAAQEAIVEAIRQSGDRPEFRSAGARMCLRLGAFDLAEKWGDDDVKGHLALFRGDVASASKIDDPLIRGAALTLSGDDAAAEAELRASDGWEARVWCGEIEMRRGNYESAVEHFRSAAQSARGLLISAQILEVLAKLKAGEEISGADGYIEFADALSVLCGTRSIPDEKALEQAIALMRGNRTLTPTHVRDGHLQLLRFRPGPRYASRQVMNRVATSPEDELLADFESVVAAHPDTGIPRCYRAELNLWLGRYQAARVELDDVLARFPYTRWAYIGRATVDLLEGKYADALEVLALGIARKGGTIGPPGYAVRGEILRRMGRIPEAIKDLEIACKISPRRLSAWINLALATGRSEIATFVMRHAAPLFVDAADMEAALALMQGNRSSSGVTWRVGGKPLRFHFFDPDDSSDGLKSLQAHELAYARKS